MLIFPDEYKFSFDTLFGSRTTYQILKNPDQIAVYRIDPIGTLEPPHGAITIYGHEVLAGPDIPPPSTRDQLIQLLTSKTTFRDRSVCIFEPGVLVRVSAGPKRVDLLFCFKCNDLLIIRNDRLRPNPPDEDSIQVGLTSDRARILLHLFQSMFPHDTTLRKTDI